MSNSDVKTTDDYTGGDWLLHVLWEHYPEMLPRWEETPLHIRQHLMLTARKIRGAVNDGKHI